MISLLVPSRGRPKSIYTLWSSIERTVWGSYELIIRLDDDDPARSEYPELDNVHYLVGPRTVLSAYWNECQAEARGDVFWHGGDDVVFRTIGWDEIVFAAFPEDGIAFVHGHDLSPNGHWLGTHGFLTRRWVDTVGYFVPPYFSSDYNDMWLVDVADMIDRHVYVPIVTEHLHPSHGKGEWDQTHQERIARHEADDMDAVYRHPDKVAQRIADAAKLRGAMS